MSRRAGVLLDASVLIAAAGSETGGSSATIQMLIDSSVHRAAVSGQILRETLVNLRAKFSRPVLARFFTLLADLQPDLVAAVSDVSLEDLPVVVPPKDHHVLHSCVSGRVAICLTLDRRHLLNDEVRRWAIDRGFRLFTPGEFLEWLRIQTV